MANFKGALAEGFAAVDAAEIARQEIAAILQEVDAAFREVTKGRVRFHCTSARAVAESVGGLVVKRELFAVSVADSGYPVTLTLRVEGWDSIIATRRAELVDALQRLLSSFEVAQLILQVIRLVEGGEVRDEAK